MIKNFLNISDLNEENIFKIISNIPSKKILEGKNIGLLFEKQSTRTRLSFEVGIQQLGGHTINLRLEDLNYAREESFEDTFSALNCYLDGLVYRTTNHQNLIKATKYFNKPVINALSDISHPCQVISDLFTLYELFQTYNLNIIWIGDINNVCYSYIELAKILKSVKLTICCPDQISKKVKIKYSSNIRLVSNINDIDFKNANAVMTDVFISMNDEKSENKIELLKPYQVTKKIMDETYDDCVFMHCLPAKIGFEVTNEVFQGKKSIVWKQAENRLHGQKRLFSEIIW